MFTGDEPFLCILQTSQIIIFCCICSFVDQDCMLILGRLSVNLSCSLQTTWLVSLVLCLALVEKCRHFYNN